MSRKGGTGRTAALILAAGAGRRFGGGKQWYLYKGKPLLAHAIVHCKEAACAPIWVVTGFEHHRVAVICQEYGARSCHHSAWDKGMFRSVNFGLETILKDENWEQLVVMAGDMPWFDPSIFLTDEVASLLKKDKSPVGIAYPEGVGLPLLLSRDFVKRHCYFVSQNEKHTLKKTVLASKKVVTLPFGKHTQDIDRPEDLKRGNLPE